jgi:phosphatidylinositol alpha-1,6-mannosyltransferase
MAHAQAIRPEERLRIGLIAPEFPPEIGGMHTLARGFAEALASVDEVSVYTPSGRPLSPGAYRQRAIMTGRLVADAAALSSESVDVWVALNAGLLPLLPRLTGHRFVYVHGKDFLTPWISYGPAWLEAMPRPHVRIIRKALRRRALVAHRDAPLKYLTNSRQTAALAAERLGIDPGRIVVCPPGVEDRFFQPKEPAPATRLRLITVSRLTTFTRRKNVDGVLRAVALLRGELPVEYVVVGDGDDRAHLEQTARALGVGDAVSFKGALSAEDLARCYRDADLFVLASKATAQDFEGFGIVYLEACASGLPVLCSAEGGATDAVEDGRNGILIAESSPEAIAAGIRRFVVQRDRLQENAVRAWAEQYRWPRVAARLRAAIIEGAAGQR